MESFLDKILYKVLLRIIKFYLLFYAVNFITTLVNSTCFFIAWFVDGKSFFDFIAVADSGNFIEFLLFFKDTFIGGIPFGDVFDSSFDGTASQGAGGFYSLFMALRDGVGSWQSFSKTLLPGLAISSMANLFIHLLNRFNRIFLLFFKEWEVWVANYLSCLYFAFSGYVAAITAEKLIFKFVNENEHTLSYILLFIVCVLIHTLLLCDASILATRVLLYLIKNLFIGFINSLLIWAICYYVQSIFNGAPEFKIIVPTLIFIVILTLEQNGLPKLKRKQ